ncbi:MAG TPA: radical SAM protein [Verrucomicrobiae bacterium]|nr:radical SAM protein [Verrucomicrobiae bacterium]
MGLENGTVTNLAFPNLSREWIVAQRPPRTASLDPFTPNGFFFEEERAASGHVVSSGTILLANKECPWRCLMCDLWKNTLTRTVPRGAISKQIEFALARFGSLPEQLKLYNSGSFFDPAAIPVADYVDIAEKISFAKHVVVESHPRLVGGKACRLRDLLSGSLEVAMGLETIHPQVLPRLNKKFDPDHFARAAELLRREGIAMRAFVLVKPPFLDDAEAIEWAVKSSAFAFDCGAGVVSLIPTRGGNGALERLREAGDFAPPRLSVLERTFEQVLNLKRARATLSPSTPSPGRTSEGGALGGRGSNIRVFADTWDLEAFSDCDACFEKRRQRLRAMNLSQTILPAIRCEV